MTSPEGRSRAHYTAIGVDPGPRGGARDEMLRVLMSRSNRRTQATVLVAARVALAAMTHEATAAQRAASAMDAVDRYIDTLWEREYTVPARIQAVLGRISRLRSRYKEARAREAVTY